MKMVVLELGVGVLFVWCMYDLGLERRRVNVFGMICGRSRWIEGLLVGRCFKWRYCGGGRDRLEGLRWEGV